MIHEPKRVTLPHLLFSLKHLSSTSTNCTPFKKDIGNTNEIHRDIESSNSEDEPVISWSWVGHSVCGQSLHDIPGNKGTAQKSTWVVVGNSHYCWNDICVMNMIVVVFMKRVKEIGRCFLSCQVILGSYCIVVVNRDSFLIEWSKTSWQKLPAAASLFSNTCLFGSHSCCFEWRKQHSIQMHENGERFVVSVICSDRNTNSSCSNREVMKYEHVIRERQPFHNNFYVRLTYSQPVVQLCWYSVNLVLLVKTIPNRFICCYWTSITWWLTCVLECFR